jgi:integrase/recombinase XerD
LHLNLNHTAIKLLQRHKGINEELVKQRVIRNM